ncbi:MAG: hypothetical protein DMG05_22325 [Acidobacteria bacterium]|nr:MAG: hypothetical protein DMG05_22325 [Acidobacteriota bacterium]
MPAFCEDRLAEPCEPKLEQGPEPTPRLTQRAYLNIAASLLDYTAKIAVGLLVTPILVGGLGRSLFGVWEMLSRLVGYMSATDGRPTQALRLVVANQQSLPDLALKRRSVGSAMVVWLLFLPVLAGVGTILVWFSPTITKVSPDLQQVVRLTCALLVLNFLLSGLVELPESILRGMNLGYRRMGLQAGLSVVAGLLTVGAICRGLGLIGVAAAQIALAGVTAVFFWLVAKKCVPWFGVMRPTKTEIWSLLGMSTWYSAGDLITKLLLASDVIILGMVASPSTVTTYVLTGYAARTVLGIMTITLAAVTPGLGGVIGQKQYQKAFRLRREMIMMSWCLVTAIGSTILLWNRSFLYLWVGREHYAGFWANLLIVAIMVQTVFIRSDSYVIDATLRLRDRVLVTAIAAVVSIVLSVLLIPRLGIVGLCLGILGGRMIQSVSYPFLVRLCLGRSQGSGPKGTARPAIVMGLLFVASGYLGQRLLAHNWIEWTTYVGGSFGIILCIALVTGLSNESKRPLIRRFRMIWQWA